MRWNSTSYFKGIWHEIQLQVFFYTVSQGPWAYHQGKFEFLQKFAKKFVSKGLITGFNDTGDEHNVVNISVNRKNGKNSKWLLWDS